MKVCTDACILGAWVAEKIQSKKNIPQNILDIGCGTGLLCLMLAQKTRAAIDAVEINEAAFLQASYNFSLSPWKNNIHIHHTSINSFRAPDKYDLIICNPPFYTHDLKTRDEDKNIAMHATELSYEQLALALKNNIQHAGKAAVLLPYSRIEVFKKIIQNTGLFVEEQLNIAHSFAHPFFRVIFFIGKQESITIQTNLFINNNANEYSAAFKELMADYYLKL